jgi:multidrug resistance efflux pump
VTAGAELLALKQEMFAADSDRFDNAARQAVRELKQAAEKCATATEAIAASLAKLEGAPEMRKRASEGAKIHAARVAARAYAIPSHPCPIRDLSISHIRRRRARSTCHR